MVDQHQIGVGTDMLNILPNLPYEYQYVPDFGLQQAWSLFHMQRIKNIELPLASSILKHWPDFRVKGSEIRQNEGN